MHPIRPFRDNPLDGAVGGSVGWRRRKTELLFTSRWYQLRHDQLTLPSGKEITYTYMEHPGAALVIPFTSTGKITLIHIYRYPVDGYRWGIPGGGVGDKPGRTVEQVAADELAEEMGGVARHLESLGSYDLATGVARIKIHYFLGHDVRRELTPRMDATEVIDRVKDFTIDEVLTMIQDQQLVEIESALGILLAINRRNGSLARPTP